MRTIKFRGKASYNKGMWLYGDLIKINNKYHILGKDEQHKQKLIRIYNFVNPYLTIEANSDLKIIIGLH